MVLGLVQRPELNGKLATVSSQGAGADADARVAATVAVFDQAQPRPKQCSIRRRNLRLCRLLRTANQRRRALAQLKLDAVPGLEEALLARVKDREICLHIARFLPAPAQPFVFSGFAGGCRDTVYMWDGRLRGWAEPTRMSATRIDCAAVAFDGGERALFAGGVDDHPARGATKSTAVVYDALTNSWEDAKPMAGIRHGCAGTLVPGSNRVFVVGGQSVAPCPTARAQAPAPPLPRVHHL